MLTRRHIRVKVMQTLYAMSKDENPDREREEKFLRLSIAQMYDLYLILVQLFVEVHAFAKAYTEKTQKKHLATAEERNPNLKFVNNVVLKNLSENELLKMELKRRKLKNWERADEYVDIIYHAIRESKAYEAYMATEGQSFKEDRDVLVALFREAIAPNEKLYDYIEDANLTWVDDLPLVNTILVKRLGKLKPSSPEGAILPKLYKDEEDEKFARELFLKTSENDTMLTEEIVSRTPNWDKERIADIDMALIKMALCEFLKFPTIPVKATMNEYLEVAKEYSTPKSSLFINGILDRMAKEYKKEDRLNKAGRGLIE